MAIVVLMGYLILSLVSTEASPGQQQLILAKTDQLKLVGTKSPQVTLGISKLYPVEAAMVTSPDDFCLYFYVTSSGSRKHYTALQSRSSDDGTTYMANVTFQYLRPRLYEFTHKKGTSTTQCVSDGCQYGLVVDMKVKAAINVTRSAGMPDFQTTYESVTFNVKLDPRKGREVFTGVSEKFFLFTVFIDSEYITSLESQEESFQGKNHLKIMVTIHFTSSKSIIISAGRRSILKSVDAGYFKLRLGPYLRPHDEVNVTRSLYKQSTFNTNNQTTTSKAAITEVDSPLMYAIIPPATLLLLVLIIVIVARCAQRSSV